MSVQETERYPEEVLPEDEDDGMTRDTKHGADTQAVRGG